MLCLAELGGLLAELGLPGQLDLLQLDLVLVDHPLVMVGGDAWPGPAG